MHGVAYNAQIISAENGDPGPEDGIILGNDGAVYKAGWDALVASGARIINNSWGSQPKDVSYRTLADLHAAYAQHFPQGLPARSTVKAELFGGALVEIEVQAFTG